MDSAGRRSNGLSAPAYGVLAQCEPQLADALLGALAGQGIAAYAVPYEGSVGGYLEVHPPERPLLRLWVDAAALPAARVLLEQQNALSTEPAAAAVDSAWQEIVASLRRTGPDGPAPWPAAEGLGSRPEVEPTGAGPAADPGERADPGEPAGPVGPTERPPKSVAAEVGAEEPPEAEPIAASESGWTTADREDEHFLPPAPPPVPVPTGPSAYAIAALIGGFTVLLVPTMVGDSVSPALLVLAIAAIVGGFVTLVAGMRQGPPADSDSDDGAVL